MFRKTIYLLLLLTIVTSLSCDPEKRKADDESTNDVDNDIDETSPCDLDGRDQCEAEDLDCMTGPGVDPIQCHVDFCWCLQDYRCLDQIELERYGPLFSCDKYL